MAQEHPQFTIDPRIMEQHLEMHREEFGRMRIMQMYMLRDTEPEPELHEFIHAILDRLDSYHVGEK